jgi:hypothetical protein
LRSHHSRAAPTRYSSGRSLNSSATSHRSTGTPARIRLSISIELRNAPELERGTHNSSSAAASPYSAKMRARHSRSAVAL